MDLLNVKKAAQELRELPDAALVSLYSFLEKIEDRDTLKRLGEDLGEGLARGFRRGLFTEEKPDPSSGSDQASQ